MHVNELTEAGLKKKSERRRPTISVISPVYQAEDLIDELVGRLSTTLALISEHFEIILIDDGSIDKSWSKIEMNCKKDIRIRGIQLSRNFGQHFAITAGIDHARGEWMIIMDCDLQDRPEEITHLYHAAICGNWDIVLASRIDRQDRIFKRSCSKLFYRILSFLSGTQYDHTIANFGIYHARVIGSVLQMREKIRYFPAMIQWVGFKKTSVQVRHSERPRGESSYNFKRQLKLAVDIVLAYSDKPLRLIVALGLFFSLFSFACGFGMLYLYLSGRISVIGYASLIISICFFSGVIISVLGIIGLYIGKIFDGIKNRPAYLVRELINE